MRLTQKMFFGSSGVPCVRPRLRRPSPTPLGPRSRDPTLLPRPVEWAERSWGKIPTLVGDGRTEKGRVQDWRGLTKEKICDTPTFVVHEYLPCLLFVVHEYPPWRTGPVPLRRPDPPAPSILPARVSSAHSEATGTFGRLVRRAS